MVATPTRQIKREVWAAGRAQKRRNAALSDHRHKNDACTSPSLSCFICKANHMPGSHKSLSGHLAVLHVSPAQGTEEGLLKVKDIIV